MCRYSNLLSYEGSRDSDPRYVILARIKQPPYPFVVNLHLTTLVGERPPNAWDDTIDAARNTRQQQLRPRDGPGATQYHR